MATVYYGETDRTRGIFTYSTSMTDTQFTITVKSELQFKSYYNSGYRIRASFNNNGNITYPVAAQKTGYAPQIYNDFTTAITTKEYSVTYSRQSSVRTITIGSEYYGEKVGSYYAGGKSGSTTVTITIPPIVEQSGQLILTYNANGGEVIGTPSQDIYTLTDTIPASSFRNLYNISSFGLQRAGYHIDSRAEWNTKADGTGENIDQDLPDNWTGSLLAEKFGVDLSTGNKNVTLYANWKENTASSCYLSGRLAELYLKDSNGEWRLSEIYFKIEDDIWKKCQ